MLIKLASSHQDEALESFRPATKAEWHTVISGEWSESAFHEGNIAYLIANPSQGLWIMESSEWSNPGAEAEDHGDEDEEPVDAATQESFDRIVAVGHAADESLTPAQAARLLYDAWLRSGRARTVDVSNGLGLLC